MENPERSPVWSASFTSGSGVPGKLMAEGQSLYFSGKVAASFPEGDTFPDRRSTTEFPPSCPGCQARRMASGRSRQEAVSITPAILRMTTVFLPLARKASETFLMSSFSVAESRKSPSVAVRSWPSPALRPMVTRAMSAFSAILAATAASRGISSRGCLPPIRAARMFLGGPFFSRAAFMNSV